MKNTFGRLFQVHTFGESHGVALGCLIDGMPSGVPFRGDILVQELERRRPGHWAIQASVGTSPRQEPDSPELLSGVYQGLTLGTPIAVIVRNQDQKSSDYHMLPERKGHADSVWKAKFGHVDARGGGRSSGRETLSRVIGGAFAKMLTASLCPELKVVGFSSEIGAFALTAEERRLAITQNMDGFIGRFPSAKQQDSLKNKLLEFQQKGDSLGGIAEIVVTNPPIGIGQPVFHKLKNDLASALMSIGAISGVEIGSSNNSQLEGSQFHSDNQTYGGIQGGISNGDSIEITVRFKPTSSISDVAKKGRHDPCIIPRAIPVLEAMVHLVLADHLLWRRLDRISWESL